MRVSPANFVRSLCLAGFLFLGVGEAKATVGQLGSGTFATHTNTLSFTMPAGGSRILMVVVSDDDAVDIVSVSYGGLPMTQRAEVNDGFVAVDSIWTRSMGPSLTPGLPLNITVVTSGPNTASFIAAVAFHSVDQTTPISGVQSGLFTGIPAASTLNVPSAVGNMVFDIFDNFSAGAGTTVTPGPAPQTLLHNGGTLALPFGFAYYRTSTKPGAAGNVPMSWSTSNGEAYIHIALNINAMTTAAGVSVGGRVLTADGRGIRNAAISITDPNGVVHRTITSSFGYYRFDGVPAGSTCIVQVSGKGYVFAQPTRTLTVQDELTGVDFIADP